MTKLQQIQFDILVAFDNFCTENDLIYSLAYGTAIGAVRHQGFIPWDDDVDVIMPRKDFEKLASLWKNHEDKQYFLQHCFSDPMYPYPFAKIRDNNTTYIEQGNEHLAINHGVFIDVFILDYIPVNKLRALYQLFCAEWLWILSRKYVHSCNVRGILCKAVCMLTPESARLRHIDWLQRQIDVSPREEGNTCKGVANLNYGTGYAKQIFPPDMFDRITRVPFESHSFAITADYDSFLTVHYGDYMTLPPENKRSGSHPYFFCDMTRPFSERDNHG